MKPIISKKSEFIIKLNSDSETQTVKDYYDPDNGDSWVHFEYAIISKDVDVKSMLYDSIPNFAKSLPFVSFKTWLSLPEYDLKDVAFNQRKVIGYKLIKPEYKEAVRAIINREDWFHNFDMNMAEKGFNFAYMNEKDPCFWASIHCEIKKAGVLDIWFEEVFEKESITLKSGVKLSEDDIAEVKEILNNK